MPSPRGADVPDTGRKPEFFDKFQKWGYEILVICPVFLFKSRNFSKKTRESSYFVKIILKVIYYRGAWGAVPPPRDDSAPEEIRDFISVNNFANEGVNRR